MRLRLLVASLLMLTLVACGTDVYSTRATPAPKVQLISVSNPIPPGFTQALEANRTWHNTLLWNATIQWNDTIRWNDAVAAKQNQRKYVSYSKPHHSAVTHKPVSQTSEASSDHCGGDLPPCWVMTRESHGNLNAYNPTGCDGLGCRGKWQCNPNTCSGQGSEEQQDNEARVIWDNGNGCEHWNACS